MDKSYERVNWSNDTSKGTFLNDTNLNIMDKGIDTLDDRVIELNDRIVELEGYEEDARESSENAEVSEANAKASEELAKKYMQNAFAGTPEGYETLVNDVSEGKNNIALARQTIGLRYECKNLLKYPYLYTTRTQNGIDWTDNGDGTVTADGTDTGTNHNMFSIASRTDTTNPLILPKGTYTVSGTPSGGSKQTYCIQVGMTKDDALYVLGYETGDGLTFTLTEDTQLQINLLVVIGQSVSSIVFKPMIRLADITDDTYAQYIEDFNTRLTNLETALLQLAQS